MNWPSRFGSLGEALGMNDLPDTDGKYRNIISDEMEPLRHSRTGQIISSKAKWNAANRATGLIEHNGTIERKSRHDVDSDNDQAIQKAIVAAENGNLRITEAQRAWAKQNDARIKQQFGVDVSDVMKSRY